MKRQHFLNKLSILLLSLATIFIAGCSKDAFDSNQELRLSVPDETVYTDAIEYSFDIVAGCGGYNVEVMDDHYPTTAKVTLSGNHVKVDLITEYTNLKITDKENQTVNLQIISSNESIKPLTSIISLGYGDFTKTTLSWGAGGYSVLNKSGDAAEIRINDNDEFIIKSIRPGRAFFTIIDSRGSTNFIEVLVRNGWNLDTEELSVAVKAGGTYDPYSFPLKYGAGGWKITSRSSALQNPFTLIMPEVKNCRDNDVLYVYIPEEINGSLFIQLEDKAKNIAIIRFEVI